MPTGIIPPNQHLRMTFDGSRRGRAKVYAEASGPITVYITTLTGAQRFSRGEDIQPLYDSEENVHVFNRNVALPKNAGWCLLLVNYAAGDDWDDARAIHYEVDE